MDHQWRATPGPTQGNIYPRCPTPRSPNCPPNPSPRFQVVHNPLNIDEMYMQNHPPGSLHTMVDPFHCPRYWERTPNSLNASHCQYQIQSTEDFGNANYAGCARGANAIGMGTDYGVIDRSSKRLKTDGTHIGSYGTEAYHNPSMALSNDDERRLKMIHEHGRGWHETSVNQAGHLRGESYGYPNTPHYNGRPNTVGGYARPHTIIRHPDQTTYAYPGPGSYPNQPTQSTVPARSSFVFPVGATARSSTTAHYPPHPEAHQMAPVYQQLNQTIYSPGTLFLKDSEGPKTAMSHHNGLGQHVFSEQNVSDKQRITDVASLIKPPNRDARPDHFVIILRGLPGSGKSYLARMIRDMEVEHGGKAPRIHSMDDYYMTEVDKVEENESSKSFVKGKKAVIKKVLEYCYEAEMDQAYRSSMLKAFKKTLDEGSFAIVIDLNDTLLEINLSVGDMLYFALVDDRNLRVADFAQFWATAKRSGYEVYLLETSYKDAVGCAARNIHGFTRDDIEKMAGIWEEAPSLYFQLDAKSLLQEDHLKESNIEEVDMDMGDDDLFRGLSKLEERKQEDVAAKTPQELGCHVSRDNGETDDGDEEIKDISCSKWSGDLDEGNVKGESGKMKYKSTSVSEFSQAAVNGKEGKSVSWGNQIRDSGFSICAMKKEKEASLIIGPGPGYNLKSNPLAAEEEEAESSAKKNGVIFQQHLRLERQSFKAVFDRKRKA